MAQNRRDFLSGSIAVFTVSKAGAEAAPPEPPRRLGLVTSITFDPAFQVCFFAGLASLGWHRAPNPNINLPTPPGGQNPGEAHGQYGTGPSGHAAIRNLIHVHGNNIDLIVVAGGLTGQAAALEELQPPVNPPDIPFVYLAGHLPPAPPAETPPGKYCGAVMNISALYADSVNAMGVNRDGIWLVENNNSDFSRPDANDWMAAINPNVRFFFDNPPLANPAPPNARNAYNSEITTKLQPNNPTGVVVSPDPYFRSTAQDLADEMRTVLGNNIPIFYPFPDFLNRPLRSPNDGLVLNVPKLSSAVAAEIPDTAYYQLGLVAGRVLSASTSANKIPPMRVLSRIWAQPPPPSPWGWSDL